MPFLRSSLAMKKAAAKYYIFLLGRSIAQREEGRDDWLQADIRISQPCFSPQIRMQHLAYRRNLSPLFNLSHEPRLGFTVDTQRG